MHYIFYAIGAVALLVGALLAWQASLIMYAANGLLVSVLFAAIGKGLHLLSKIEEHLRLGRITRTMHEERRATDLRYPRPIAVAATDTPRPDQRVAEKLAAE